MHLFCPYQVKTSDVPKRGELFPNRASQMACVPERDTLMHRKKILILNLNNFFSRPFKKNLNGQKLDNLFTFKLPKFGGHSSKL